MNNCTSSAECQGYTEGRVVSVSGANISFSDSLIAIGSIPVVPGILVSSLVDGTSVVGNFSTGRRSGKNTLITMVRDNAEYEYTFSSAGVSKIVPTDNFDHTATLVWGAPPKPTKPGGTSK